MSIVKGAVVSMVLVGACVLFINGVRLNFRSSSRTGVVQFTNITDSSSNSSSSSSSTTPISILLDDDRHANDTFILNNTYKPLNSTTTTTNTTTINITNTTTILEDMDTPTILKNPMDAIDVEASANANSNANADANVNITIRNLERKKRGVDQPHPTNHKRGRRKRGLKPKKKIIKNN